MPSTKLENSFTILSFEPKSFRNNDGDKLKMIMENNRKGRRLRRRKEEEKEREQEGGRVGGEGG